jgi:hypothetical protein
MSRMPRLPRLIARPPLLATLPLRRARAGSTANRARASRRRDGFRELRSTGDDVKRLQHVLASHLDVAP